MRQFVSIQLGMGRPTVSVVTAEYFSELQISVPRFYSEFNTQSFTSALSFTQLTALLPFRIDVSSASVAPELWRVGELSVTEARFLDDHRAILSLYWSHNLPPLPPWRIVEMDLSKIHNLSELATQFRLALERRL